MRKGTRIVKRLLALFLVVLMSINSFGAVVSDNDGSAFITKAEFDSLKNNFQAQIDQYNTSIDSKIDGAIANYLAGTKMESTGILNVINAQWKKLSCIGGVIEPEFVEPNVDFLFSIASTYTQNDGGNYGTAVVDYAGYPGYLKSIFALQRGSYTNDWSSSNNSRRNVVTTQYNNYYAPGKLVWRGRALRWLETWNITRSAYLMDGAGINIGFQDVPAYIANSQLQLRNFTKIVGSGSISNWASISATCWPIAFYWSIDAVPVSQRPGYEWMNDHYEWQLSWAGSKNQDQPNTTIQILPDSAGDTYDFEHIIAFDKDDAWWISSETFADNFFTNPESTVTSTTLFNKMQLAGECRQISWNYFSKPATSTTNVQFGIGVPATVDVVDVSPETFPTLGMFTSRIAGAQIFQHDNESMVSDGKIELLKPSVTLEKGFQLLVASEGDKITWEPSFIYTHVHDGDDTYAVDNTSEVDIYFSNGPFTNKVVTTEPIRVQVNDESGLKDYATTTNRKCKVSFEMPHTGLVYVKFAPHFTGTSYIDDDWIVTLDLENSNKYTYSRE